MAGHVAGVEPMETMDTGLGAMQGLGAAADDGAPTRDAWHSARDGMGGSSNSGSSSRGRGRSRTSNASQDKDSGPDAKDAPSRSQGGRGGDDKDAVPQRTRRLHRDSKDDQGALEGVGNGNDGWARRMDFDDDDAPATAPAKHAARPRSTTERSRKTQRK